MKESRKLRRRLLLALLAALSALAVCGVATFAWYIFAAGAHTTRLHMAAGTSVSLQISSEPEGNYSSAVALEKFQGLLTPVSTDRIARGFQKAEEFLAGEKVPLVAAVFGKGETQDYYSTSLYFHTNARELQVCLADVGYRDEDEKNPISSAIRLGLVIPATGEEFIFALTDAVNPQREYNTAQGWEGCVLNSARTDGSTVEFTPLSQQNYCGYDEDTGAVYPSRDTVSLCTVSGDGASYGDPVRIDVYIWLEGCDPDCTANLCATTLSDLALRFVGVTPEALKEVGA